MDGEPIGFDHLVRDGEHIDVYPLGDALDAPRESRLCPRPSGRPRFVLDGHLGTLARYLRLCGFDTRYRNDFEDAALADISAADERILLTRDRNLLKRRIVTFGYWVRHDAPREQLAEVSRRFDLAPAAQPFTRCARCNGLLEDVDKAAIEHRLEPLTRRYYQRFRRCRRCGQLYWHGSHVAAMRELFEALRT